MIQLSYDLVKHRLILIPGKDWDWETFNAAREPLICWKKRGQTIVSEPLQLAYNEALEVFGTEIAQAKSMRLWREWMAAKNYTALKTTALKPIQVEPTLTLCNRQKALLTALPGVGKTIMTIAGLSQIEPGIVVIVAPLSLLETWESEVKKWWAVGKNRLQVTATKKVKEIPIHFSEALPGVTKILITSPECIQSLDRRDLLFDVMGNWVDTVSILVLDESFLYKNKKAKRTRSVSDLATAFDYTWGLSGMPVAKFNDDLFAQLHVLFPQTIQSYWKFAARYCYIDNNIWGSKVVGDRPNAIEKIKADLSDVLIPCDFPPDIPDWEPERVNCVMSPEQTKIYELIQHELTLELLQEPENQVLTIDYLIVKTIRLLQAASNPALFGGRYYSAKEEKLIDLMGRYPLPCLIWVNFIETGNILYDKLSAIEGLTVGKLTGATPSKERGPIVKAFQEGRINCLIAHPGVGKYGHTLTKAKTMYYFEKSFRREEHGQTLYRVRRIVSEHACKVVHLLATKADGTNTIDHLVDRLVARSAENAMLLTVGDLVGSI